MHRIALLCIAVFASTWGAQSVLFAETFYWQAPDGGSGLWNTTLPNWSQSVVGPAGMTWNNSGGTAPHDAVFGGSAGTVTNSATIVANLLQFAVNGYTISGSWGMSTFGADTGSHNATLNSPLNGSSGFNKYGSGTLSIAGQNSSLVGPIRVQQGTLFIGNGTSVLPSSSTTIVENGATLEIASSFGLPSFFNAVNVAVNHGGTFRMAPGSTSSADLNNVYLAGGSMIGAATGFGGFDMRMNGALITRGQNASTVNVGRGIQFEVPSVQLTPYVSFGVNDVTGNSQADLLITGTASSGALQNLNSFSGLIKTGAGTLVLDAPNSTIGSSAVSYSVQRGTFRLQGAGTANRMPEQARISVAGVLELADTNVLPTTTGVDVSLYGGKLNISGANTARNHLRNLNFVDGGIAQTVGVVSSTAGENLRVNGTITVTGPLVTRALPARIELSHGIGFQTTPDIAVANSSLDGEADLIIAGSGGIQPGAFLFSNGLTKSGTGTLRIETLNTYRGPTGIAGGVLSVSTLANGGVPSGIGQSDSFRTNLTISSGTLRYTGSTVTTDRGFTIGSAGGAIEVDNPDTTLTFTGTSSSSGPLNKLGPGALSLTAAQFFSSSTSVSDGIFKLSGSTASLNGGTGVTVTGASGLLSAASTSPFQQMRNGLLQLDNLTGNVFGTTQTVSLQGGTLLYTPQGAGTQTTTVSTLSATGGANTIAVAASTGPDELQITRLNRTTGATVDFRSQFGPLGGSGDNGRIVITNLGTNPIANINGILGGWAISNDAAVGTVGADASNWFATHAGSGNIAAMTNYSGTQTSSSAIASATSTQNWLANGGSSANRTLTGNTTLHSLITGGANANDGDVYLSAWELKLGSGGLIMRGADHTVSGSGSLTTGMASGELFLHAPEELSSGKSMRIASRITNNGSTPTILIKDGPGEIILDTFTSHTGGTRIHQGRLTVLRQSTLSDGPVTVLPGGQLNVADGISSFVDASISGSGPDGSGALRFAGTGGADVITLNADSRIEVQGSALVSSITGSFGLEKTGPGTLRVFVDAAHTGPTLVSEGTLSIETVAMMDDTPSVTVGSNGTFHFGRSDIFSSARPGNFIVNGGTVTSTDNTSNLITTLTMTGGLISPGALTSGSRSLVMSAATGTFTNLTRLSTLSNSQSATIAGSGIQLDHLMSLFIDTADGPAVDDLVISGQFRGILTESVATKFGAGRMVLSGTDDNVNLRATLAEGSLVLAKTSSTSVHALGSLSNSLTISGGTLQLAGSGGDQIYAQTDVVMDSGVFDFNGRDEGFDGLSGQSGVIRNDASGTTSTMTVGENNGSSTWYGAVQDGAGTMAVTKVGTGTISLAGSNSFTGGATVAGGTLRIEGTLANASSGNVKIAPDPDGNFSTPGPTVSFDRLRDSDYAGLGSQSIGGLNSSADLLGGSNTSGSDLSVDFRWRVRTTAESTLPASPPLALNDLPLLSNVVNVSGMVNNRGSSGQTDLFVLQMSYDPTLLESMSGVATLLGWLDPNGGGPGIPQWRPAIEGNLGPNSGAAHFQGSWLAAGSPLTLGSSGIDTTANVVWAVVNHNSQFAVITAVPEPSSFLLAMVGVTFLTRVRRLRINNRSRN